MTKRELAIKIARKLDVDNRVAEKFVETFIDEVIAEVKTGGDVRMNGFGSFSTVIQKERIGIIMNGRSGKSIGKVVIPEHRKPRFKAGDHFKQTVKEA